MVTLSNGDPMPPLVYGTAHRIKKPAPDVYTALTLGYRALDTASARRFHDEGLDGTALSRFLYYSDHNTTGASADRRRSGVFVQSKFAPPSEHDDASSCPYDSTDVIPVRVYRTVLRSAESLSLESLDACLLHVPLPSLEGTIEAWRALEDIHARGGVRYLGISNVRATRLAQLFDAVRVKPAIVQNWFRRRGAGYDAEVVGFCCERGVLYQAFGVFDESNSWLRECEPVVQRADAMGVTRHAALLGMLLGAAGRIGLHLCILDGTTDPQHMKENLRAVDQLEGLDPGGVDLFLGLIGWPAPKGDSNSEM